MTGILHGVRVLDLTRMLSGPYATMMLADHGAEVVKIEDRAGDTSRANGPFRDDDLGHDWAGYFVSLNRSKKSIALDLKTEADKADFRALVAVADVVVENFRPGVMERLGLSYESLAQINPRLVYAAVRGFGDPRSGASPYADWPSYDVVAQAMGGLISLTGPDADTPTKAGPGIGDVFADQVLAGNAEMDVAARKLAGDFRSRQEQHLGVVDTLDAPAIITHTARAGEHQPRATEERIGVFLQAALGGNGEDQRITHHAPPALKARSIQMAQPTPGTGLGLPSRPSSAS